MCFNITIDKDFMIVFISSVFKCKIFKVYMKYVLRQSNILQYIFSWTFTQLKYIKHKISCSSLADFVYQFSILKVQLQGIFLKYINMYLYYTWYEINVFQILLGWLFILTFA